MTRKPCRGLSFDVPDAHSPTGNGQTTPAKVTAVHEEYLHTGGVFDGKDVTTKLEMSRGASNV